MNVDWEEIELYRRMHLSKEARRLEDLAVVSTNEPLPPLPPGPRPSAESLTRETGRKKRVGHYRFTVVRDGRLLSVHAVLPDPLREPEEHDTRIPLTELSPALQRGVFWWASQYAKSIGWDDAVGIAHLVIVEEAKRFQRFGPKSFDRYILDPGTGYISYAYRDKLKLLKKQWEHERLEADATVFRGRISSEKRKKKFISPRETDGIEYPVLVTQEDDMLLNKAPEGFELHTTSGWTVCGGIQSCVVNAGQAVMRRPATHPHGYGVMCLDCYPALTAKDNSRGNATPIHDLPYEPVKTNEVRNVGANRSHVEYS